MHLINKHFGPDSLILRQRQAQLLYSSLPTITDRREKIVNYHPVCVCLSVSMRVFTCVFSPRKTSRCSVPIWKHFCDPTSLCVNWPALRDQVKFIQNNLVHLICSADKHTGHLACTSSPSWNMLVNLCCHVLNDHALCPLRTVAMPILCVHWSWEQKSVHFRPLSKCKPKAKSR